MNNFLFLKEGGLFDFDLTFLIIIFEIIFLSFILNQIFYKPLLSVIEERRSYINEISEEINAIFLKADELLENFERIIKKQKIFGRNKFLTFEKTCLSRFDNEFKLTISTNNMLEKKYKYSLYYQTISMAELVKKELNSLEESILLKIKSL